VLGLALMMGQAFLYNAIFFTYALVLTNFYGVDKSRVGMYLIPFAIGNVLGPLTIGRLFDTIGRRVMITFTYVTSGVLLAITGWLFAQGVLDATTQTIAWCIIFFFASAGASSAYLTVSEVFPLEIRAMAIALFYAVGTGAGGFIGPVLFGALIQSATAMNVFYGYLLGATLMVAAGLVEAFWGVETARRSLEDIAAPLSLASFRPGPSTEGMGMWSPYPESSSSADTRVTPPSKRQAA
jgi:MFS family permease